mgnify:CR=1 FL=1
MIINMRNKILQYELVSSELWIWRENILVEPNGREANKGDGGSWGKCNDVRIDDGY